MSMCREGAEEWLAHLKLCCWLGSTCLSCTLRTKAHPTVGFNHRLFVNRCYRPPAAAWKGGCMQSSARCICCAAGQPPGMAGLQWREGWLLATLPSTA